MITTELTYRLYEEKDLPHVLRLWEESSGWGAITEEQFHQWYLNTPYGPCIVIVASDEDDNVVGQLVFTPSHVQVTNKVLKAVRAAAPILHESFKGGKIHNTNIPFLRCLEKDGNCETTGIQYYLSFPRFRLDYCFKIISEIRVARYATSIL
jgi:hypothetical protein